MEHTNRSKVSALTFLSSSLWVQQLNSNTKINHCRPFSFDFSFSHCTEDLERVWVFVQEAENVSPAFSGTWKQHWVKSFSVRGDLMSTWNKLRYIKHLICRLTSHQITVIPRPALPLIIPPQINKSQASCCKVMERSPAGSQSPHRVIFQLSPDISVPLYCSLSVFASPWPMFVLKNWVKSWRWRWGRAESEIFCRLHAYLLCLILSCHPFLHARARCSTFCAGVLGKFAEASRPCSPCCIIYDAIIHGSCTPEANPGWRVCLPCRCVCLEAAYTRALWDDAGFVVQDVQVVFVD